MPRRRPMTPEHLQQIESLFGAALKLKPQQRPAFLESACRGDGALRKEVESLLASHEAARDFMVSPALEVEARAVANDPESMRLSAGIRIGRYQILAPIGAGGMGEVYLAQD